MTFYADSGGGDGDPLAQVGQSVAAGAGAVENSFFDASSQIRSQVAAGHLKLDDEGTQALISALEHYQDWYTSRENQLQAIAQAPKLGGSVAAQVVAPHMHQTGVDAQGYVTQLRKFAQAVDHFKQTLKDANDAYHRTEAENAEANKRLGDSLNS
ncbi:MAG: hypothetical protein ACRDQ5_10540 [Sciscionella sp.]